MLSIIIPVFNQHEMTTECLAAIREHTSPCGPCMAAGPQGTDYEVIVVDNGSTPAYIPTQESPAVRTIRNPQNLGFPVAVNQGIRAALGEVICLLNNDVIVTPGWADKLVEALQEFHIVGPMTNYCAGIQRTILPVYYDRKELDAIASEWGRGRAGRILTVNWVIGFCFLFRRDLYDEIGGFDESLWPCSGEEIDFCFRARERGRTVGIAQDVYLHHEGSVTFKALDAAGEDYKAIVERNNTHLAKKWGEDFWQRQLIPFVEEQGVRLNLGCGKFKLPGCVNIDQSERVRPDLVCDVLALPYDPGTVDEIYAGHVIEHFSFTDGIRALTYWHGLLREDGLISISTPDYDYLARDYLRNPTPERLREMNDLYIYSEFQESPHRYMYSGALLEQMMADAGFAELSRMPIDHPYFPAAVEWQVGFQGRKLAR